MHKWKSPLFTNTLRLRGKYPTRIGVKKPLFLNANLPSAQVINFIARKPPTYLAWRPPSLAQTRQQPRDNQKIKNRWFKPLSTVKKEHSYLFIPHWKKDFISNSKRIHSFFRPLFWFGAIHHRAITRWWYVTLIHPYTGNALMIWQAPKSPESCHSHDVLLRDTALIRGRHPGTQQWENYTFWLQNFLTINNNLFHSK